MPPPTPLECSSADCEFKTPAGCPSWELMAGLLQTHSQTVHGGGGPQQGTTSSKLEKLPRPTFTLNMTESQWSFKQTQWDNYIKQSVVPDSVKLMQLQAACDDSLRQRVFDTGTYSSLTTEDLFMKKMKELSVIVVHKSIYLMNLWKMRQQSDELIRAFAARVTSTADSCNMVVKCPNTTCQQDVTYRDHVVHQIIIHGMKNNDIRVRVLSRNTSGELTTLDKLINYIAAEEAGNAEASDLVSDSDLVGGIRRRSSYSELKNGNRKQTCQACGEARHDDRKKQCKAWGQVCDKCKKVNHFAKVCKSAKASAIEAEAPDTVHTTSAEVNSIRHANPVASFFSLQAGATLPTRPADIQSVHHCLCTDQPWTCHQSASASPCS